MSVPTITLEGDALQGVAPHLIPPDVKAVLPSTVRLGRKSPKARPPALPLEKYLDLAKAVGAGPPDTVDWTQKAAASLNRVYGNDQWGDCVIAGKYHAVGVWSGNDRGAPVLGTDQEVLQQYHAICGPGDDGCVITQVLDVMRARGLPFQGAAHKIDGYVHCDWRRQDLVKAALYLFGCLTIGINLPDDWTREAVWGETSSKIVGGHDVTCVGYDPRGVMVSSWGRVYLITWPAFTSTRWLDECYCLLGPDWYNDDRLSPNGVDVAALRADLDKIAGGTVPPIDPGPTPPAPPVPPGPPPAPYHHLLYLGPLDRPMPPGRTVKFKVPPGVTLPAGVRMELILPASGKGDAEWAGEDDCDG